MRFASRLIIGLLAILALTPLAQAKEYTDVPTDYKYYQAISTLSDENLVSGYPDDRFLPENSINRAEATKILMGSLYDTNEIQHSVDWHWAKRHRYVWYYDVKISQWYAPFVEMAHNKQAVQGYPDNNFRPENSINFAEGLKMILKSYQVDVSHTVFQPTPYLYVSANDWFTPYFSYAWQKGLINKTKFYHPAQLMTRGEFVDILYRLREIQNNNLSGYTAPEVTTSNEYRITIPALDIINAPVGFANPFDEKAALDVLHRFPLGQYLFTPDYNAKTVLFGHSSGYSWDHSPYKRILRQINKVKTGDMIYINYKEKGYIYQVYKTELIPAKQDNTLMQDQKTHELVMYTCWPPDRIDFRYAVFGKPIS